MALWDFAERFSQYWGSYEAVTWNETITVSCLFIKPDVNNCICKVHGSIKSMKRYWNVSNRNRNKLYQYEFISYYFSFQTYLLPFHLFAFKHCLVVQCLHIHLDSRRINCSLKSYYEWLSLITIKWKATHYAKNKHNFFFSLFKNAFQLDGLKEKSILKSFSLVRPEYTIIGSQHYMFNDPQLLAFSSSLFFSSPEKKLKI